MSISEFKRRVAFSLASSNLEKADELDKKMMNAMTIFC